MEDNDEVRNGKFEWNIDNFLDKNVTLASRTFKLGKYDCYLKITKMDEIYDMDAHRVYLTVEDHQFINYKAFCKLSLIDARGEEVLVSMRSTLKFKSYIQLMKIFEYDLFDEVYDLVPEGVLTLRLSWSEDENSFREWDNRALKHNLELQSGRTELENRTDLCQYSVTPMLIDLENPTTDCACETVMDLNSEKEPSKLLQKLSQDFGRFYESRVDTDVFLRVGKDLIPVHGTVLSARSKVFANMFCQDISKDQSDVVDIPDFDAIVFMHVLYYVYSGQTRGLSSDTMFSMYYVAKEYALIELKDICLGFIMRSLTVENMCKAALLAYTQRETKLLKKLVLFARENRREFERSIRWRKFLKSEGFYANVFLRSIVLSD